MVIVVDSSKYNRMQYQSSEQTYLSNYLQKLHSFKSEDTLKKKKMKQKKKLPCLGLILCSSK